MWNLNLIRLPQSAPFLLLLHIARRNHMCGLARSLVDDYRQLTGSGLLPTHNDNREDGGAQVL